MRISDAIYLLLPGSEALPMEHTARKVRCIPHGYLRTLVAPPHNQILKFC